MTSQLPSTNRYMEKAEEQNRKIQARVNRFLKNIQEIKHLNKIRSAIRVPREPAERQVYAAA